MTAVGLAEPPVAEKRKVHDTQENGVCAEKAAKGSSQRNSDLSKNPNGCVCFTATDTALRWPRLNRWARRALGAGRPRLVEGVGNAQERIRGTLTHV